MSINEISKKFVLSKYTLRYWEKVGLLSAIKRDEHGYRQYSEIDQNWIFYIKVLRIYKKVLEPHLSSCPPFYLAR